MPGLVAAPSVIRFSARADALRALRHGANAPLLDTWVAQVFSSWRWDERAQEALDRLLAHPDLPPGGISRASLPAHVLRDPQAMEAARAAGFDLARIRLEGKITSVRLGAIEQNAPPQVHALLDAAGIADLVLPEIARALPLALRRRPLPLVFAFEHLMDRHAPVCKHELVPATNSILVDQVVKRAGPALLATDDPVARRTFGRVLHLLAWHGVDYRPVAQATFRAPARGYDPRPLFHECWAQAMASRLDAALPPPDPDEILAPRPRPRM